MQGADTAMGQAIGTSKNPLEAGIEYIAGELQAVYVDGAKDSRPQFPYSGTAESWAAEGLAKYGPGAEAWLGRWEVNCSGDKRMLDVLAAAKVIVRTIQKAGEVAR